MQSHRVVASFQVPGKNKWCTESLVNGSLERCKEYAENLADNCTNAASWIIRVLNSEQKTVWCETFFGGSYAVDAAEWFAHSLDNRQ